jgi:TonB family protein
MRLRVRAIAICLGLCAPSLPSAIFCPALGAVEEAIHPVSAARFIGRFVRIDDSSDTLTISALEGDACRCETHDWDGLGVFYDATYRGVFRFHGWAKRSQFALACGTHRGQIRAPNLIEFEGAFTEGRDGAFNETWRRVEPDLATRRGPTVRDPDGPEGRLDILEGLPEIITRVDPVYPLAARRAGVDGTVLVQALVGADGRVKDTKIIKSIPALDAAAVAAVRQWVFKPGRSNGRPAPVWVAVPVKFTLH